MKVRIHSGLIDIFQSDAGPYSWARLPHVIGLSAKTLIELEKGGLHKVETVFQLERALGYWVTKSDNVVADGEIYEDPFDLDGVSAFRQINGSRIYAIALPSSGLIKLIEDNARVRLKNSYSELGPDDPKTATRELAFENYLYNHQASEDRRRSKDALQDDGPSQFSTDGINTIFQFTIDEEARPLTKAQEKYVRQLDECIRGLISNARSENSRRSSTLKEELEADTARDARRRFMDTIASLKRVNINVLAYESSRTTRVFDSTYYEPLAAEEKIYGPETDYYLFTFKEAIVHIILAPAPYLRLPVPHPISEKAEWLPETMWACKATSDGGKDWIQEELGHLGNKDPIETVTKNVIPLVTTPNDMSEEND